MALLQSIPRRVDTADAVLNLVRRIAAIFLILQVLAEVLLDPAAYRSMSVAWVLAIGSTAALTYVLARPTPTTAVMFACAIPAVVQFTNLVVVDAEVPFEVFQTWARAAGWMILLSVPLRRARIGVTAVCGAVCVVVGLSALLVESPLDWYALVVVSLATYASGMALAIGTDALFRSARSDDVMQANQLAAERAAARECAQEEEANRTSWLLHDTVVNTLAAVATARVDDSGRLANRCADDLAQLDRWLNQSHESGASRSSAVLWANVLVERAATLDVTLSIDRLEGAAQLPTDVTEAAIGALTEALNNISKHAPGTPAELFITMDDRGFTGQISDFGPGLRGGTRRGIATSIAARCRLANIVVEVKDRPGRGVVVSLSWHDTTSIEQVDQTDFHLRRHVRDAVGTAMVWILGLCLAPVLLANSGMEFGTRLLGWSVAAVLALLVMQRWRSGKDPYWWTSAALIGGAATSSFLYALPFGTQINPWPYTVGLLTLVLSVAVRQSLLLLVCVWGASALGVVLANPAVLAQVADRPGVFIAEFNIVALLVSAFSIVALRRYATQSNQTYRDTKSALVRADSARVAQTSRRLRANAVAELVRPFMRDIAEHRANVEDPTVRHRAHVLATASRAATNVPTSNQQLEQLLLNAIVALCTAGFEVHAGVMQAAPFAVPTEVDQQLNVLVGSAAATCPLGSRVTLSVAIGDRAGDITVVIDPLKPNPLQVVSGFENEDGQLIATLPFRPEPAPLLVGSD